MKRHQEFTEKQCQLSSDKERLELFAEYILMESGIQRMKYKEAFSSLSRGYLFDLTRNLWNEPEATRSAQGKRRTAPEENGEVSTSKRYKQSVRKNPSRIKREHEAE